MEQLQFLWHFVSKQSPLSANELGAFFNDSTRSVKNNAENHRQSSKHANFLNLSVTFVGNEFPALPCPEAHIYFFGGERQARVADNTWTHQKTNKNTRQRVCNL
jgi:hypothetical protein